MIKHSNKYICILILITTMSSLKTFAMNNSEVEASFCNEVNYKSLLEDYILRCEMSLKKINYEDKIKETDNLKNEILEIKDNLLNGSNDINYEDMYRNLHAIVNNIKKENKVIEKEDLLLKIALCENILSNFEINGELIDISSENLKLINKNINDAKSILSDNSEIGIPNTIILELDKIINKYHGMLEENTKDKASLLNTINENISEYNNIIENNESDEKHTRGAFLESSIAIAEDIYNNKLSSTNELQNATEINKKTTDIIKNFNPSIYASEDLLDTISTVEYVWYSMVVGDEIGQYPKEIKDSVKSEILKAKEILENGNSEDIVKCTKELTKIKEIALDSIIKVKANVESKPNDDVDDLDNKVIKEGDLVSHNDIRYSNRVNKAKLQEALNKAEKTLKDVTDNNQLDFYTKESIDLLQEAISNGKVMLNLSNASQEQIDIETVNLNNAINKFLASKIEEYVKYKENLKSEIEDCIQAYENSIEGESLGEVPAKYRAHFKNAIESAKKVASSNSTNKEDYINAINILEKAKERFEDNKIGNEDIENARKELEDLLNKMTSLIKKTPIGPVKGGVASEKKTALYTIKSDITSMMEDSDDIMHYRNLITMAKNAISDFNDRSISIDDDGIVSGRLLTGKISSTNNSYSNEAVVSKEMFIPQAGLPIDVKMTLLYFGTAFISVGVMLGVKDKSKK